MTRELTSLDMYYLMQELQVLASSKTDRIYHGKEDKNTYLFTFFVSSKGKMHLHILLPNTLYLSDQKSTVGTPTGFCMMLRKYLEGSILTSITQKDFQRIIEMHFDARFEGEKKRYILILELFSKGNVLFCDEHYKILNLHEKQEWKARTLAAGETYQPPQTLHNALTISEEEFSDVISHTAKESIVKTLAIELNLAGVYAEEVCARAGVDKKSTKIIPAQVKALYKSFRSLFSEQINACAVNGKEFPFMLEVCKVEECKKYDSFSQAIKENQFVTVQGTKGREKLNAIIQEQEQYLVEYESLAKQSQEKAEKLYEEYQFFDNIIKTLRAAKKQYGWSDVKKRIAADKKYASIIKNMDEKNNTVTISIDEKEQS